MLVQGWYSHLRLRVALIGYGNVGKALMKLVLSKQSCHRFSIVGVHTRSHGTAYDDKGLEPGFTFGPAAATVEEFLGVSRPDAAVEITTLNPESGEPALSYIRSALTRKIHVVTANKGPIAHAYSSLRDLAGHWGVKLRFESTVMDGTPVFNMVRNNLPEARVLGFTGAVNSTSKLVVAAMERGLSMQEGIAEAQAKGVAESNVAYDLDGWDSAVKTASLANVLMEAQATPLQVSRTGLGDLTTEAAVEHARNGQTVVLVSRAHTREDGSVELAVAPEVLPRTDVLAMARGTSNALLIHTDLMGTIGTMAIDPGVEQTAYGVFSDLIDIARSP